MSFNIGPPTNDRVICQLSDSDHTLHPSDLKLQAGFAYRGAEVKTYQHGKNSDTYIAIYNIQPSFITYENPLKSTLPSDYDRHCYHTLPLRRQFIY